MTNQVAHFAIHADDLERARSFYGRVFGWTFQGYGGPMSDFCMARDAQGNPRCRLGRQVSRYRGKSRLRGSLRSGSALVCGL